jgi:opacity protein-like surface antigen
MPLATRPLLACLLLGATVLMAQDRPPRDEEDFAPPHSFAWQAQFNAPLRDFRDALDAKSGLGLGMQWQHRYHEGIQHRTRLEWNVFPEGPEVGPAHTRTQASNIILSFDRMFYFRTSGLGPYLTGGLGAVRWMYDETNGIVTTRWRTTKLNVMAGIGLQLTRHISLEGRYQVSSIRDTMDGNSAQVVAAIRY